MSKNRKLYLLLCCLITTSCSGYAGKEIKGEGDITFGATYYVRGSNTSKGQKLSAFFYPVHLFSNGGAKHSLGLYADYTRLNEQETSGGRRYDISNVKSAGISYKYTHNDNMNRGSGFYISIYAGVTDSDFVPKSDSDLYLTDEYSSLWNAGICGGYQLRKVQLHFKACIDHKSLGNKGGLGVFVPGLADSSVPNIDANSLVIGAGVGF